MGELTESQEGLEEQPWEVKAGTMSKPNLEENLPVVSETRVQSLGQEDPLGKGMSTRSSVLAWRIPWTEEPGGPHSSQGRTELDATDRLTLSHSLLVLSLPGHWMLLLEPWPLLLPCTPLPVPQLKARQQGGCKGAGGILSP